MGYPDFESPAFLRAHVQSILAFYDPHAFDPAGGFFHYFLDDGTVYERDTRHLVSSTRFVFNYANAWLQTGDARYRSWAGHGFDYLRERHQAKTGHYVWQLRADQIDDGRAMAYGHAFVLLAAASASRLQLAGALDTISQVFELMERYFWDEAHGAYADERDASLARLAPYRGQNANMHAVEALIAAYETTLEQRYLDRARRIAHQFCVVLAAGAAGEIWEHYDANWRHDWQYNIDKPDDLFKPWGVQPGHQVEWAKLLLHLDRLRPEDWYRPTARALFDAAMSRGWDQVYGGLVYGCVPVGLPAPAAEAWRNSAAMTESGPESGSGPGPGRDGAVADNGAGRTAGDSGEFADAHKYFWVQAEAIATAWRLYDATGAATYRDDYHRLWRWSWDHLVDHQHGGWYRLVTRAGKWLEPQKSPAGKVDYHTMGACWDVLAAMGAYP